MLNTRILSISFLFGVFAWVLDAAFSARADTQVTFLGSFLFSVPPERLAFRVVVLALLLSFGFILSNLLRQREFQDRESAHIAHEESKARFEELADLLPEPIFEADLDFRVRYANQRAFELFGYTQEDFEKGLSGLEMLIPSDRPAAEAAIRLRAEGVYHGVTEYTALRKDGSTIPILFHASLVRVEGRPAGIRGIIVDISERIAMEDGLKESEKRFRNIVESCPMGIHFYELQSNDRLVFTGANRAADEILGVDCSSFIGMTIEEAFPPLTETQVPDRYREVAATGKSWHSEQIDYSHDEISGAFEVSAFQTVPNAMATMFVDITERKQAERTVRASEERLRLATRSGRVGVWEYQIATDHLDWDDLMYEMHGVNPAEGIHGIQRWRDCVHPDDLERAEGEFRAALPEGGPTFDAEFRIRRRDDGELRFIRGLAGVFRDEEGVPVRAVGTNWDITASKRIEDALRDSEERFRGVIEQSNDAIYILANGRFDLVNPRFCEITGVPAEEATHPDFDFWELVAPSSLPLIRSRQEQRERGEQVPDIYEFEIKRPDGRFAQVEASVAEIEYEGGTAVLGVLRDITEQKSLKEQFLLAQKMESIGRLSGGVAHDLNNLLTPIFGYGNLILEESPAGDERRETVQEILKAATRARDLVRQLLAFSRRQTMEFRAIDLNEMVEDFQSLLRRTIREDIEIRVLIGPTSPTVQGDRGQLEQVIMNLAVNAQDAMPGGGVLAIETSEIELDEDTANALPGAIAGRSALLSITDSGVGMNPETRSKIFEPFFTTKALGKGTGLGLATVYGIVKQHDGNIGVDSEAGEGTTIRCYLPVSEHAVVEAPKSAVEVTDLSGTETIMVVEDEAIVRDLVTRVLRSYGYSVLEGDSGEKCLEILRRHKGPLDMLLTDVVMPGMTGRELFEKVRTEFPNAKVLCMSGYTEDVVTHRGIGDDEFPFIQKPFSVKELALRVRESLEADRVE